MFYAYAIINLLKSKITLIKKALKINKINYCPFNALKISKTPKNWKVEKTKNAKEKLLKLQIFWPKILKVYLSHQD